MNFVLCEGTLNNAQMTCVHMVGWKLNQNNEMLQTLLSTLSFWSSQIACVENDCSVHVTIIHCRLFVPVRRYTGTLVGLTRWIPRRTRANASATEFIKSLRQHVGSVRGWHEVQWAWLNPLTWNLAEFTCTTLMIGQVSYFTFVRISDADCR